MSENIKCGQCRQHREASSYIREGNPNKPYKTCEPCRIHIGTFRKKPEKSHECDECKKKFTSSADLKRHVSSVHNDVRNDICEQCGMAFLHWHSLKKHIETVHEMVRNYACTYPDCSYKASIRTNLNAHIKAVHDMIRDYECPYPECKYKSSTKNKLECHVKAVHDKIQDNICFYPECEYKSSDTSSLKQHIKAVHDMITDHECPYSECDFKSSTNRELQNHIKAVHDRIRDNICNNCNYRTAVRCNLMKHMSICTGLESISFGEFTVRKALNEMSITHTREVRFQDCKNIRSLPFDFFIESYNSIIEYDGEQHYFPVKKWGGEEALERTQLHDLIKNEYCRSKDIHLLRIKYTEIDQADAIIRQFLTSDKLNPAVGH